MTDAQIMAGLLTAKSEVNLLRFHETQFNLPLADAKLVRVSNYLGTQIKEIEQSMWAESELTEV